MSKLGRKLTIIAVGCMAIAIVLVMVITLILARDYSDTIVLNETSTGMNVLKHDVDAQVDRMSTMYETFDSSNVLSDAISSSNTDDVASDFESHKSYDGDFMALADKNGNVIWKSANYKLADADFKAAIGGAEKSGILEDSAAELVIVKIAPVHNGTDIVGAVVIGMSLSECEYLDTVKAQTSAEVTVFHNTTRFATTVLNESGGRAVGTEMAANVAAEVITNGKEYYGQADILGQNHYVKYEPMTDMNGKIVGAYFAGISSKESDDEFNMLRVIAIAIAVVAAIVSAIVLFLTIRNSIERPIGEAEKLAEAMGQGNLNYPDSTFNFADDEIGNFVKNLEHTKRNLNLYVGDISRILEAMANGDFTQKPSVSYIGDFVTIRDSFEVIAKTLSGIIQNMNMSANDVMSGSSQIAGGSQMLADGTTRQASAIQELSSTIADISNHVRQSASNAAKANELSLRSRDKISLQNEEMIHMLEAMEEIKTKSNEISNIIKAIDDIAFQTNILALNAAVEAARAGDAGKGFAVVADEVRTLAGKSAESAKSTGDLIHATIEAVTNGADIAERTAEIMKEVMDISGETNLLITEISSAAADQAESIKQVTVGIEQISTVVQQNSATAEETAASCQELSSQSKLLKNQVDKLRI